LGGSLAGGIQAKTPERLEISISTSMRSLAYWETEERKVLSVTLFTDQRLNIFANPDIAELYGVTMELQME
jgi:hypothetical protein